jgi:hypothetical protein
MQYYQPVERKSAVNVYVSSSLTKYNVHIQRRVTRLSQM